MAMSRRLYGVLPLLLASFCGFAATVSDREGIVLGSLLSSSRNGEVAILTETGFLAVVSGGNGSLQGPFEGGETVYLDASCSGPKYVKGVPVRPYVFRKGDEILYVENEKPLVINPGSSYYIFAQLPPFPFPTCHEILVAPSSGNVFVDPWKLNDPGITGISDGPFAPPLRITHWIQSQDGFEQNSLQFAL